MSACRACQGCAPGRANLCHDCWADWEASPEHQRQAQQSGDGSYMRAMVDFINRARAERQNGRGDASGT